MSRSATLAVTGFSANDAFRRYLARAESLGFESAWAGEQVLGSAPHLDPMDVLTYAAGCTERLRLGCAVFVRRMWPSHGIPAYYEASHLSGRQIRVGANHTQHRPSAAV